MIFSSFIYGFSSYCIFFMFSVEDMPKKGKRVVQGGREDDHSFPSYTQGRGVRLGGSGDDRSSPSIGRGLRIGGSGGNRSSSSGDQGLRIDGRGDSHSPTYGG
ncbi:hypothetical protein Droror1_Dr00023565 [Drosera rotundifolia]